MPLLYMQLMLHHAYRREALLILAYSAFVHPVYIYKRSYVFIVSMPLLYMQLTLHHAYRREALVILLYPRVICHSQLHPVLNTAHFCNSSVRLS